MSGVHKKLELTSDQNKVGGFSGRVGLAAQYCR